MGWRCSLLSVSSRTCHSNQAPGILESLVLLLLTRLQAGYSLLEPSCPHSLARHRKQEKAYPSSPLPWPHSSGLSSYREAQLF